MRLLTYIIIICLGSVHILQAQNSEATITVTGSFGERPPIVTLSPEIRAYTFIKENAGVVVPEKAYFMKLDEETSERMQRQQIAVIFLNDLQRMLMSYSKPVTLEVTPLDTARIPYAYLCKGPVSSRTEWSAYLSWFDELSRFLDNPAEGDTLFITPERIDSRYTRQLVKCLANPAKIVVAGELDVDMVDKKGRRISPPSSFDSRYYWTDSIAGIARKKLDKFFRPFYWGMRTTDPNPRRALNAPLADASPEEWQAWLDSLPHMIKIHDTEYDIPFRTSRLRNQSYEEYYGYPGGGKSQLSGLRYDSVSRSLFICDKAYAYLLHLDTYMTTVSSINGDTSLIGKALSTEEPTPSPEIYQSLRYSPGITSIGNRIGLPNGDIVISAIHNNGIQEEILLYRIPSAATSLPEPLCVATHIPGYELLYAKLVGLCKQDNYYYLLYQIKEMLVWCKIEAALVESVPSINE